MGRRGARPGRGVRGGWRGRRRGTCGHDRGREGVNQVFALPIRDGRNTLLRYQEAGMRVRTATGLLLMLGVTAWGALPAAVGTMYTLPTGAGYTMFVPANFQ